MPNTNLSLIGTSQRKSEAADNKGKNARLGDVRRAAIFDAIYLHGDCPLTVQRRSGITLRQMFAELGIEFGVRCKRSCSTARLLAQRSMLPTWTARAA